ncbi:hypothetical protein ACOME3_000969 [Neoechinorhynchus agilis]
MHVIIRRRTNGNDTPMIGIVGQPYSRLHLLLGDYQFESLNIPLPTMHHDESVGLDENVYIASKSLYSPVTEKSPMFAIDFENIILRDGKTYTSVFLRELCLRSTVVSIAVVNENLECVYKQIINHPDENVHQYVTFITGITKDDVAESNVNLSEAKTKFCECIPDDGILVGHAIGNDLRNIKLFHPYLIDTSAIFTKPKNRLQPSLKELVKEYLNRDIQPKGAFHCPIEDARAAMELVQWKLQQGISAGDARLRGNLEHIESDNRCDLFNILKDQNKCYVSTNGISERFPGVQNVLYDSDQSIDQFKPELCCLEGLVIYEHSLKEKGNRQAEEINNYLSKLLPIDPGFLLIVIFDLNNATEQDDECHMVQCYFGITGPVDQY